MTAHALLWNLTNKARCLLCNDVIESTGDIVWCKCRNLYVDGGVDYPRRGTVGPNKWEDLSEYRSYLDDLEEGPEEEAHINLDDPENEGWLREKK